MHIFVGGNCCVVAGLVGFGAWTCIVAGKHFDVDGGFVDACVDALYVA